MTIILNVRDESDKSRDQVTLGLHSGGPFPYFMTLLNQYYPPTQRLFDRLFNRHI